MGVNNVENIPPFIINFQSDSSDSEEGTDAEKMIIRR